MFPSFKMELPCFSGSEFEKLYSIGKQSFESQKSYVKKPLDK